MDQTAAVPPPFIYPGLDLWGTVFQDQFSYLRINTENKREDVRDLAKAHGHQGGLLECCHLPAVNQGTSLLPQGFRRPLQDSKLHSYKSQRQSESEKKIKIPVFLSFATIN